MFASGSLWTVGAWAGKQSAPTRPLAYPGPGAILTRMAPASEMRCPWDNGPPTTAVPAVRSYPPPPSAHLVVSPQDWGVRGAEPTGYRLPARSAPGDTAHSSPPSPAGTAAP